METSSLEKFSAWARRELIARVSQRCALLGLDPLGEVPPADADAVAGRLLSAEEKSRRAKLLDRIAARGYDVVVGEAASSWFNRLAALRYMEVNDFLPGHVRVLSAPDGLFEPQALKEAALLDLPGLDTARVTELQLQGKDEELFRMVLLAQCEALSQEMRDVFGAVGEADALLLPDGLLDPRGFVGRLVLDLPDGVWRDAETGKGNVETLGWLYQFYIAERKDEVFAGFKKGKKAGPQEVGPATQLFTPDWIVRYMVQNSLGRLWMLNNPQSRLVEQMEFYIAPEGDPGEFLHIEGPEDIAFCDPACGSGHILVYAFDLLAAMYEERGYRASDVPALILEKNLCGMEIDPRAAQLASLALTMKARELDRRFLRRGIRPQIELLAPVTFDEGELPRGCALEKNKELLDALAHMTMCGSLLTPTEEDLAQLRDAIAACPRDLAGEKTRGKLEQALGTCEALARKFDVVVANPPYMGSSNFDKWTSAWVKKDYPDVKSDLFSAFIVRNMDFAKPRGEVGMMTPFVWMFIGSYEKLRNKLIDEKALTSLIQLEYSGFAGATVPICTFTFHNGILEGVRGGYVRLSDFVGSEAQGPKALEAIQNPACGWFYRADAATFKDIPGTPIAYWASEAMRRAFVSFGNISDYVQMPYGFKTGDNERFLRFWWECEISTQSFDSNSYLSAGASSAKWFPYNKGGQFRKWYGNREYVFNFENEGEQVIGLAKIDQRSVADYNHSLMFAPTVSWSRISSGRLAMRYSPEGAVNDMTGPGVYGDSNLLSLVQAIGNSSVISEVSGMLSPTLDFQPGQVGSYPCAKPDHLEVVSDIVAALRSQSKEEYDSSETSWDFRRSSLV